MNRLFFGDNLHILRKHVAPESVDLVYLDPPFNSKRDYNLLFKTPKGQQSDAQITAFEDSWQWGPQAEDEFREIQHHSNTDVALMMLALRGFLGTNDVMAYLTMMANRLLELRRVLKPTGSLYLHCDPTASHYLKIVLDAVFGPAFFKNEIIWKRANAHNDPRGYGRVSDTILFYTMSAKYTWNQQHTPYREEYYESHYKKDADGRYFRTVPLDAPKHGAGSPNLLYEWRGKMPSSSRTWAIKEETMKQYEADGRLRYTKTGTPTLLQYADEMPGVPLQNIWTDIPPVNPQATERLGYPTQKPLALLERIIASSSNEGDVVLDPFCGCGTAVHAAQKLKRAWIGIDITHLAVGLIESRMKKAFPALAEKGALVVEGVPRDLAGASDLALRDKYEFQLWALSLVRAQPFKGGKKGADGGVDGLIFAEVAKGKTEKIIVSVKGGESVTLTMLKDLITTVTHNKAALGLFVTLSKPTKPMIAEAATAGHYESPLHGAFPRIQILTIEGLLHGNERARYPDLSMGAQTIKPAKTEPKTGVQTSFL